MNVAGKRDVEEAILCRLCARDGVGQHFADFIADGCPFRSSYPGALVMQAAEDGDRGHPADPLNGAF